MLISVPFGWCENAEHGKQVSGGFSHGSFNSESVLNGSSLMVLNSAGTNKEARKFRQLGN